jgi:hypothetical protein
MKPIFKNRRGIIDLLLAGIIAIGSLLLPALQSNRAYNRSLAPGTSVTAQP